MLPFLLRLLACWSLLGPSLAQGQQEAAPAAQAPQPEQEKLREDRKLALLRLRIEVWEIAALDAARWLDEAKGGAGLAELRSGFLSGKRAARLVSSPTLSLEEDGQRRAESIAEWIYPIEYEGAELPGPAKPPPASAEEAFVRNWWNSAIGKFTSPSSFEVRNLGDTLEADIRRDSSTPGAWDLSLSVDMVQSPGELHFGAEGSLIKMPLFNTFRSSSSSIGLKEGCWRIFSVMEAPRGLDGKTVASRWLTLVRIDPEP